MSAGIVWLVAAALSGLSTFVFREDSVWYPVTLGASAVAVVVGVLLMFRPVRTTAVASVLLGVGWVVLYLVLLVVQFDDVGAWTADAFFAFLGALAAFLSVRAGGGSSAPTSRQ